MSTRQHLFVLFFFFILCYNVTEAQTYANIPGPENVLVVYNSLDQTSIDVKDYYKNARGIPDVNVVGLDSLFSHDITINDTTHRVIIAQEGDIIQDSIQNAIKAVWPKFHAWRYYLDYVAAPIKDWITSHNLTSTIRYIVLCKGVPFKIQAAGDWALLGTAGNNVTVDGLLSMLNTDNYESFIDTVYKYKNYLYNPYFNADPNYTMNYRFIPDHFTGVYKGLTYKLSYLVSHLDGISYDIVKGIIDRSINPDMSGTAAWVLDGDPTWSSTYFNSTRDKLVALGFNVDYDNSNTWITSYPGNVMGYTSWGTHAEDGNCSWEDSAWVKDSLKFNLSNGSVFNTIESFNGNSLTTLKWRYIPNDPSSGCNHTQGLATQFTEIGGTGTMGHAWEPSLSGIVDDSKFFPAYAIGYNLIDAVYQGMYYLAHQNVVVGDPLTVIAWGKQTLTQNVTWQDTNLVTDTITIPLGKTLTISANSVINLRHYGFITGMVTNFIVNDPVTFNITDWSRALFVANNNNNPKLEWGDHPTISSTNGFRVYRKIDTGNWNLLATVYDNKYIDNTVEITPPIGGVAHNIFYRITAMIDLINESDYSNEVEINGDVKNGKISANKNTEQIFSYSLLQNYPNPFNPTTTINYSIKKDGLVTLKVYDILGKEVAALVDENKQVGSYSVKFDASNLPSGVYFYRLTAGNFVETKKLILMK